MEVVTSSIFSSRYIKIIVIIEEFNRPTTNSLAAFLVRWILPHPVYKIQTSIFREMQLKSCCWETLLLGNSNGKCCCFFTQFWSKSLKLFFLKNFNWIFLKFFLSKKVIDFQNFANIFLVHLYWPSWFMFFANLDEMDKVQCWLQTYRRRQVIMLAAQALLITEHTG